MARQLACNFQKVYKTNAVVHDEVYQKISDGDGIFHLKFRYFSSIFLNYN